VIDKIYSRVLLFLIHNGLKQGDVLLLLLLHFVSEYGAKIHEN